MRYRLIILALMMTGIVCQAQNQIDKQGRKQGHWVKTDKQGAKLYEGDFVDDLETGTFTYYFPDGTVRITNTYTVPGKVCRHKVYNNRGQLLAEGREHKTQKPSSREGRRLKTQKTSGRDGRRHKTKKPSGRKG